MHNEHKSSKMGNVKIFSEQMGRMRLLTIFAKQEGEFSSSLVDYFELYVHTCKV